MHSLGDIAPFRVDEAYLRTNFHVSTLFGSSVLTEQRITLTLLVTQEMSLLGLYVRHLSGNVITYWWYTGLYISQVWSCSDHSVRMFV